MWHSINCKESSSRVTAGRVEVHFDSRKKRNNQFWSMYQHYRCSKTDCLFVYPLCALICRVNWWNWCTKQCSCSIVSWLFWDWTNCARSTEYQKVSSTESCHQIYGQIQGWQFLNWDGNPPIIWHILFCKLWLNCLLVVVPLSRFGAVPQLGGTRWASTTLLTAGQPRQQQRSGHQLPGLSERHICGGQDAPACGEVQHLQRSYGESCGSGFRHAVDCCSSSDFP